MLMCLDCFMKTEPRNQYDFYDKLDLKYVHLTDVDLKCSICGEEKPVIDQGVYWLFNPYGENPPPGYIDIQKLQSEMESRGENTVYNEGNDSGSINPQEGR